MPGEVIDCGGVGAGGGGWSGMVLLFPSFETTIVDVSCCEVGKLNADAAVAEDSPLN